MGVYSRIYQFWKGRLQFWQRNDAPPIAETTVNCMLAWLTCFKFSEYCSYCCDRTLV